MSQDFGKGKFLKGIPDNIKNRLSREEIIDLIRYGSPEFRAMPKLKHISDREAGMIADYLQQLQRH